LANRQNSQEAGGGEKMEKPRYFCQECNKELEPDQKVCPVCKSNKRQIKVTIEEGVTTRERIEAKQKREGVKRPLKEILRIGLKADIKRNILKVSRKKD